MHILPICSLIRIVQLHLVSRHLLPPVQHTVASHFVKDDFRANVLWIIDSSCPKAKKVKPCWCQVVLVACSPDVHCIEFNDPCVQLKNFIVQVDKIWWARLPVAVETHQYWQGGDGE